MSVRNWSLRYNCAQEGCRENTTYNYSTKRDMVNSFEAKNYSNGRWRCIRHTRPEEVLSRDNLSTISEIAVEEKPYGKFFGNFGFVSGQGFKAFASDFPAGTRLVVQATIVLPTDEEKESS